MFGRKKREPKPPKDVLLTMLYTNGAAVITIEHRYPENSIPFVGDSRLLNVVSHLTLSGWELRSTTTTK